MSDTQCLRDLLRALSKFEHSDVSIGDDAADEIERLSRENAELRKKLEWQPIATAPRTGIALLLAQPWRSGYDTRLIGHYANGWVIHDGRELWDVEPTHWMPLPEPPL